MFTTKKFLSVLTFLFIFLLASCNLPAENQPTQPGPDLIYTAAAQTVAAQLTQSASNTQPTVQPPTLAPQVTSTQAPQPTATQVPPTAVPPTTVPGGSTTPPAASATPVPCNLLGFGEDVDVTYPDGSKLDPGETFEKTWRLRNIGSCTWTSSYFLVFDRGDAMGAPASVQLTTGTVPPGSEVDATVKLKAPLNAGTYQGYWKLRDGSGQVFGFGSSNKAFWVKIVVANPVNYDFMAEASDADWYNATTNLTFGDSNDDSSGIAAFGKNVELEDGETYDKVLGTYPERIDDGLIYGVFSSYKVKAGDFFRATVGFKADCSGGKVLFQLKYLKSGVITVLKEWKKSCDGSLLDLQYDLSELEGQTVQFILGVDAYGPYKSDKAVWLDPRIQK